MPSSSDSGLGAGCGTVRADASAERPLSNGSGSTSGGSMTGTPARDGWLSRASPAFVAQLLDAPHRHLCRSVALSQAEGALSHNFVMPMPSYSSSVSSAAAASLLCVCVWIVDTDTLSWLLVRFALQ